MTTEYDEPLLAPAFDYQLELLKPYAHMNENRYASLVHLGKK